jgi:hypothetical protein
MKFDAFCMLRVRRYGTVLSQTFVINGTIRSLSSDLQMVSSTGDMCCARYVQRTHTTTLLTSASMFNACVLLDASE